jgi:hypothetical protein
MLNRPEPPKPTSWNVYKIDKKAHHSDRCERRCCRNGASQFLGSGGA